MPALDLLSLSLPEKGGENITKTNLSAKPPTHGLLLAQTLGYWASPCFSLWWQQAESQSCGWDKQQDPAFLEQERDWPQQQEALGEERLDPGPMKDAEDICSAGL